MAAEFLTEDGAQLRPAQHDLAPGAVVEHQRQRLIHALPVAVRATGFHGLTVEEIAAYAGVSRRAFYESFRDKEDCFLTSYRHYAQRLMITVGTAAAAAANWQQKTRFALSALLRFLAEQPSVAHMGVVEVMAAGPAALAERDRVMAALGELIGDEALATAPDTAPRLLLRTTAGSVLQLVYVWILEGRAEQLEQLLPTCMYMALVGLRGPAGAAAECGLLEPSPVAG